MAEQRISRRYAKALMNTAKAAGTVDVVYSDLRLVRNTIDTSRDLEVYLKSPLIKSFDKKEALDEIFKGKSCELTNSFLKLLAHKGRENLISSIADEFIKIYNEDQHILPVNITTAIAISDDIKQNILSEIKERTGMTLDSTFSVDPLIKGGVVIQMEDMIIDASLRNKLNDLYQRLSTGEAA